jgi:predicted alpha/beta-hydrolase family hydrolase
MTGAILLTHGAGSNRDAPLLLALDRGLTEAGWTVVRYNLPYRQKRSTGPPGRGDAELDRAGLSEALSSLRAETAGPVCLGGHSYGGRQSTILASEQPTLADGLLLLSYPLHPPRKPQDLRTSHLPALRTRSLFVHGTRDPFGSPDEMEAALALIPAEHRLVLVERAGHELKGAAATTLSQFLEFFG